MVLHTDYAWVSDLKIISAGESPAHEVIQYRGQGKGYFGHSRNCFFNLRILEIPEFRKITVFDR